MTPKEAPILTQLCTLLVEDIYGNFASRLFTILARYGRQTLPQLSQHSNLPRKHVKNSLVILIQQHLIHHASKKDSSDRTLTFYEIDWAQTYSLARYGKMIRMVEERYGQTASAIVSNLISLGHTRIRDLTDAYLPAHPTTNGITIDKVNIDQKPVNGDKSGFASPKVNGMHHGPSNDLPNELTSTNVDPTTNGHSASDSINHHRIESADELHGILFALLRGGWIVPVDEIQYFSERDFQQDAEDFVAYNLGSGRPRGPKATIKFNSDVKKRKRDQRDESLQMPGPKRRSTDSRNGGSRHIYKGCEMPGSHGIGPYAGPRGLYSQDILLDGNVVIRINPEKIAVGIRTEQLVRLCEERLCRGTARVYRTILWLMERCQPRCHDDLLDKDSPIDSSELFTAQEVLGQLDPSTDLFDGLDPSIILTIIKSDSRVDKDNCIVPPVNPLTLSIHDKRKLVEQHIKILSEDPIFHFVTWHKKDTQAHWRIEYDDLATSMIQHEIENTVIARHGKPGLRIIRGLLKKGRLDERSISMATFLSPNVLRRVVNCLHKDGFIQTQEIPRVESRMTKSSLHLIWYDRQRSRDRLLYDTYKGMVRTLQRLGMEQEKVKPVIEKAERTDVIGNEEKYLTKIERDALQEWQRVEEKLLVQLERMDDLVTMLRDFSGPLVTS